MRGAVEAWRGATRPDLVSRWKVPVLGKGQKEERLNIKHGTGCERALEGQQEGLSLSLGSATDKMCDTCLYNS